jgi:hypothetical protein
VPPSEYFLRLASLPARKEEHHSWKTQQNSQLMLWAKPMGRTCQAIARCSYGNEGVRDSLRYLRYPGPFPRGSSQRKRLLR